MAGNSIQTWSNLAAGEETEGVELDDLRVGSILDASDANIEAGLLKKKDHNDLREL